MQNQKVIERLGYSPNEAKVSLASLALGEAHIPDIAEKLDMPRSTVQAIAERLVEDGLMTFYVMRRYKYWVAEDPSNLLAKLKERENMVAEAIPHLVALKQQARKRAQSYKHIDDLGPLKGMADGMSQPVLVANSEAEIRYVNPAWEKQFGHTFAEVAGKDTRILKSGKTPPAEYDRLWQTLKAGGLFTSSAIVDQRKDGSTFTFFTIIFSVTYGNRKFYVQILEATPRHHGELEEIFAEFAEATKS